MGRQLTFTLACIAVLSAVIPGAAGYFTGRMEAIAAAEQRLHALELRLQRGQSLLTRTAGYAQACELAPPLPTVPPVAAALVPAPEPKPHKKRAP
ncbi:hypothetical protein [Thermoactinospora rubra]|uniref:hypothetical protein n=1 Tax=Thermoactinospora rubra TaxID=1088767 RepID=UPI000A10D8B6|nr:hypothetical protein [Thermoactinospora rubra]